MFPWMLDYGAIVREAAELLTERAWPRLYHCAWLAANEVPRAAVIDAYQTPMSSGRSRI